MPWEFLHSCIIEHLEDESSISIMALVIYGMVIFPKVLGYIEVAMVYLLKEVENKINPSSAILIKAFISLSYCWRNGKGRLIGCAQLLHLWIQSHFECERINSKHHISPLTFRLESLLKVNGLKKNPNKHGSWDEKASWDNR